MELEKAEKAAALIETRKQLKRDLSGLDEGDCIGVIRNTSGSYFSRLTTDVAALTVKEAVERRLAEIEAEIAAMSANRPKRLSEVAESLNNLGLAINRAQELSEAMMGKLDPIFGDAHPVMAEGEPENKHECKLANRIQDYAGSVARLNALYGRLLSRIEL
jgi:hypothetical protein